MRQLTAPLFTVSCVSRADDQVITLGDSGGPLTGELASCLEFIEQARNSGGVLVHCGGGVGRSGAIAVAAAMKDQNLGADEALALIKQHRCGKALPLSRTHSLAGVLLLAQSHVCHSLHFVS